MLLENVKPGTKEADDLAHFILYNLYEVAAMYRGGKLKSLKIYKVDENGEQVKTFDSEKSTVHRPPADDGEMVLSPEADGP